MKFIQQLEQLLKTLSQFTDAEGELLKQNVKHSAEKFDPELIKSTQSLNGKDNTTSLISLMYLLDIVKPTLLTNLV
jgi:hypothetical protein